ncbi:glycosyltransferase family 4 protein [Mesorhizobium sp.]|uniref:glycosyltransferase family 4 protein n=1 Tax=Mesorhizobium sp. TaxID=1871066 RepID=UPI0025DDE17E|nr:glycosyltransferase family 4 protein [Mesorhizobium sp.]
MNTVAPSTRPMRMAHGAMRESWLRRLPGWRRLVARLQRRRHDPFSTLAGLPRDKVDARPHLLVIVPWLPIGGAEVLLADILGSLKAEWRFSIVTTEPGDNVLTPTFAALTPEIYHLPDLLDRRHWFEFVAALLAFRGSRAILSSGSRFLYANLEAIKSRFPAIVSFDVLHNDAAEGHLGRALGVRRHIDRFIAISERIGRSLAEGGADAKAVTVIPNGIDYEGAFNPQRVDRQALRNRFGIEEDAFVIGFAGRMSEEKRPLALLAVTAPILAAHLRARLLVVGDGPMTAAFGKAARRAGIAGRLHHLPSLDRAAMPQFYAACSVLALPSRIEGTPLAMLEALAMGCPVAATDVGDAALMISEGVNGFVVPVETPVALTPRIAGLVGDDVMLHRMRAAARQSIMKAGRSAETMLNSYRTLIGQAAER